MSAESPVGGFMSLRGQTPDGEQNENGTDVIQVLPDSSDDVRRTDMQPRQTAISSSCGEFGNTDSVGVLSSSRTDGDGCFVEDGGSLTNERHQQESGERADCASEIVDIVNSLASFADSHVVTNLSECFSPSYDPQLAELNQLITELEQLQDFNVSPFQQANGAAPKQMPPQPASDFSDVHSPSSSQAVEKVTTPKVNDKVKSHPAIAALLMHGKVDPNEPFVPLKEKPFKRKPDMEGSILYLKNVERTNIGLLSAASTVGTAVDNLTTASSQSSFRDEKPNSTTPAGNVPNLMLGQGELVKSDSSKGMLSASSASLLKDADNVINLLREEYSTTESGSSMDRQLSRNHGYWRVIEDKLRLTIAQNQRLANLNVQLQAENYQLKKELDHHKAILANQSAIADLVHKLPNVTSYELSMSNHNRNVGAECDEPGVRVKRFKAVDACNVRSFPPGGLCLHIDPGLKTGSVKLCQRCTNGVNHL